MKTVISKGRHVLGKLSRNCDKTAPRNCEAALTWELRRDGDKLEFSACGEVWNHLKTDIVQGGQCVDELAALFPRDVLAQRIRATWSRYHLNGMNAGTPEQSAALAKAEAEALARLRAEDSPAGCFYDAAKTRINWHVAGDYLTGKKGAGHYGWACEALKQAGLYEVPVTPELRASALGGLPKDAETYRYGTRWLHYAIPADVLALIRRGFQDAPDQGAVEYAADPAEAGEPDRDLIAEAGLTITAVFVPWSQSRNKGEKMPSLNWRITLQCKGRDVLTCDYSAGSGYCPINKNSQFKRTASPRDMRDAIAEECERGKAVKRAFSAGGFIYGDAIEPDARDVIASLIADSCAMDSTFTDWAADYGFSPDSIAGRAVYDECIAHAVALRAAVGWAMFEALREANA